jgi:type I restriction enzyme S subunit
MEGWEQKPIKEIAQHSLGKMLDKNKNKGEPKPYLRNLNVRWGEFHLSDVLEMRFLPEEADKYTVRRGDLVICEGGYPGRAAIWEEEAPMFFQKALHRVRFHDPDYTKWSFYYLVSRDLEGTLKEHFGGAGIQHFTGEALGKFRVPIAPNSEITRIVAILDEAFEAIAKAKANTARNLANARAVFEHHLRWLFGSNSAWPETTIGEQLELQRGFDITKCQQQDGDVPVVSSGGIKSMHNKAMVPGPGVVIGRKGTLGKAFYLDKDFWPHDTTLWVKDFKGNLPKAAYYLFVQLDVRDLDSGSANPALNRNRVHPIRVRWPSVRKQQRLIEELEAIEEKTGDLAALYQRKLAALDELKRSLLHHAFTGAL